MAITHSGGDDPPDNFPGLGPIGVHGGQRDALGHPNGHDTALSVVAAGVLAFQRRTVEDEGCELEIEPALSQIPAALGGIPSEAHMSTIQLYIRLRQVELMPGIP